MRNNGFTIIELMIILSIIGIIAAVALPAFNIYACKKDVKQCKIDMPDVYNRMNEKNLKYIDRKNDFNIEERDRKIIMNLRSEISVLKKKMEHQEQPEIKSSTPIDDHKQDQTSQFKEHKRWND